MVAVAALAAMIEGPPPTRGNDRDSDGHQIGRQHRQPVVLTLSPAEGDVCVLAFGVARLLQTHPERRLGRRRLARRSAAEEPDHRHRRLLRTRRTRPGRRAAERG